MKGYFQKTIGKTTSYRGRISCCSAVELVLKVSGRDVSGACESHQKAVLIFLTDYCKKNPVG